MPKMGVREQQQEAWLETVSVLNPELFVRLFLSFGLITCEVF